jgi:hypothetical protein
MPLTSLQPGSTRDAVADWLAAAATRAARQRWLQGAAWAGAGVSVLAAGYAGIARWAPREVLAALTPLLILAGVVFLAAVAARWSRREVLSAVAAAADERAGLSDHLLSAHCFSGETRGDAFRDLHLQRTAALTRSLDVRRVFPMRVPAAAAATVLVAALIFGVSASLPSSPAREAPGVIAPSASSEASAPHAPPSASMHTEDSEHRTRASLWKQIESLAAELSASTVGESLAQAIAARDARAAAQALRAAQTDAAKPLAQPRSLEAPDEQMSEALAQGIMDRLAELLKAEEQAAAQPAAASGEADRPTARLDRELRAEQEDAQRAAPRQQSAGEDALNTSLRALSRSSAGGRDMVHGEADNAEGAGRASVGGGAMGRRVGVSSAGAGEGDQPGANVAARPDGDSIFGRRTERLAVQLRSARMTSAGDEAPDSAREEEGGTEESSYAATRAQAARVATQEAGTAPGSDAENVLEQTGTPLALREAVKRYTLARHRREARPVPATGNTP